MERLTDLRPDEGAAETGAATEALTGAHVGNVVRDAKVGGATVYLTESADPVIMPEGIDLLTAEILHIWRNGDGGDLRTANYHGHGSSVLADQAAMERLRNL